MKKSLIRRVFPESFSTKVYIRFLILVFASSIAYTAVFVNHQNNALSTALINEGLSLVRVFAYSSRLGAYSENQEFLKNSTEGIMQRKGVILSRVYSLNGDTLITLGSIGNEKTSSQKEILDWLDRDKSPLYFERTDLYEFWAPIISLVEEPQEYALFYESPSSQTPRVIGFVRIDISKSILRENIKSALIKGLLISIIFIILSSLFASYLTRNITKPLNRLEEGVLAMKMGNQLPELPMEQRDEIGRLSAAFKEMVDTLKQRESEKQKLMEQLSQSQRLEAIGTFAGGIAHDFNNILTIIQSNMELAQNKVPDYAKEYTQRALDASKRGSDLVSRLLHFTLESPVKTNSLNLGLIVQDTLNLYHNTKDSRIEVRVDIEPNLWNVDADAGQMQQVVMNLYLNARDAILEQLENPQQGDDAPFSISITLRNAEVSEETIKANPKASIGSYVLLSVCDNGSGMDREAQLHIFEPFYTTKKPGKGTGLGLSAVYGIVKRHSGWIDVRSEVGKGTTFDIYLPRFAGDPSEFVGEEIFEPMGGDETILIVDDEEHILSAMKEKLEDLGYKIVLAQSGEEALAILKKRRKRFDLIILDHMMPGISGLEVVRHVRELRIKTKVLMYSGKDIGQFADAFQDVEFISKPQTLDAIADKVRQLLGYEWQVPLKDSLNRVKLYYVNEQTPLYNEEVVDAETVYKLFKHIAMEPRETFIALHLDSQKKIICYDPLSTGTTDKTIVYPKEVIRTALLTNASSVILIHNHPSGNYNPSQIDFALTAAIMQACGVMDIEVLDHIIISGDGYYSFAKKAMLG